MNCGPTRRKVDFVGQGVLCSSINKTSRRERASGFGSVQDDPCRSVAEPTMSRHLGMCVILNTSAVAAVCSVEYIHSAPTLV
jgi:hypothetical protein